MNKVDTVEETLKIGSKYWCIQLQFLFTLLSVNTQKLPIKKIMKIATYAPLVQFRMQKLNRKHLLFTLSLSLFLPFLGNRRVTKAVVTPSQRNVTLYRIFHTQEV